MLIFLLIFALIRALQGAPTPESPDIPIFELDTNFICRRSLTFGTRSVREIVFGCLATVFACTWTAIHPNIPGPTDSGWTKLKCRVATMVYALLAPEMILLWAMGQHVAAKYIATKYNNEVVLGVPKRSISFFKGAWRGVVEWFITPELPPKLKKGQARQWSATHGFFLQMGGFMLCDEGQPIQVLSYDRLVSMIKNGEIDAPRVTEAEIQDRGKGDTISKTVVILQTTWFISQCIARWSKGLAVTELEVVTLGFALLNGITYAVWWNKPLSVGVPVYLEKRELKEVEDMEREGAETSQFLEDERQFTSNGLGNTIPLTASNRPVPPNRSLPAEDRGLNDTLFQTWALALELDVLCLSWSFDLPQLMLALVHQLRKMLNDTVIAEGDLRVPMLYATVIKRSDGIIIFASLLIGVFFGAVHLIPSWFLHFPSLTEMWLWRVSAVIITVEPVLAVLIVLCIYYDVEIPDLLYTILTRSIILGLPLYIFARFILIILAFTSLRTLPPTVLSTIDWVSSIPHF